MIPSGWNEVTIFEYKEIIEILEREDLSTFSKYLEVFCVLTESDIYEDMSVDEIYSLINENSWINTTPTDKNKENIDTFRFRPFRHIKFGEWIDLDKMVKTNNLLNTVSILYRQHKFDEWNNLIWEPYIYSTEDRMESFEDASIEDVYGAYLKFLKYREKVLNAYAPVFEQEESDYVPTEEDKEILSDAEIEQVKRDVKLEQEKQQFSWQHFIYKLCDGDLTKTEVILDLPVIYVFNTFLMKQKFNL